MGGTLEKIMRQQREWAEANGIRIDEKGYTYDLGDNLFRPLSVESVAEFGGAAGSELDTKMKALHSSSALVANFFECWRNNDKSSVVCCLGIAPGEYVFTFEKTYPKPKGLGTIPPHLDLELYAEGKTPVAIESKFCEPYSGGAKKLKEAYIREEYIDGIWGNLRKCREFAGILVEDGYYVHLDAAQLLRHIVGLRNSYGENGFTLYYLWFDFPGEEADTHREEIKDFVKRITPELDLQAMTYQELFAGIVDRGSNDDDYINYMRNRYFRKRNH